MKRIILFFGVIGFYSAAAQQKNVFDVQKYLESKKAKLNKIFELNKLFIPQHPQIVSTNIPAQNFSYTLSNGDIVMYGVGTMPIVKPNMNYFYIMPDAAKQNNLFSLRNNYMAGRIPNAATPPNICQ